jgi:hypothetical protein
VPRAAGLTQPTPIRTNDPWEPIILGGNHENWRVAAEGCPRAPQYETAERWNLGKHGFVYGAEGIDQEGRWRAGSGPALEVTFDRPMFGGSDTWHLNFENETPFFEPIQDWDD